jgi:hypothetical protein
MRHATCTRNCSSHNAKSPTDPFGGEGSAMKKLVLGLSLVLLPFSALTGPAKKSLAPVKIVMSPASTVRSADVLKYLRTKCPNVTITLDSTKSNFMLEAGGWSGRYEFTVYKPGGDLVFSTTTVMLSNAVKDVCKFVDSPK